MSRHAFHTMHRNSMVTYREEKPHFGKRAQMIYAFLMERPGQSLTDREIMLGLRFTDTNAVRPRITELLGENWLEETGSVTDPLTRKTVRTVKALTKSERDELLERRRRPAEQCSFAELLS